MRLYSKTNPHSKLFLLSFNLGGKLIPGKKLCLECLSKINEKLIYEGEEEQESLGLLTNSEGLVPDSGELFEPGSQVDADIVNNIFSLAGMSPLKSENKANKRRNAEEKENSNINANLNLVICEHYNKNISIEKKTKWGIVSPPPARKILRSSWSKKIIFTYMKKKLLYSFVRRDHIR